jgi:catechol 2,3-dioxygenase-like lactoylglutathione lyase family enzyme
VDAPKAQTAGMDQPVLGLVSVVVSDMAASGEFYGRLGLDISAPPAPWDDVHRSTPTDRPGAQLDLDSVGFAPKWDEGWPAGRTGVVLSFNVASREDVDRLHGELTAAGASSQQPPYDAFWGARYAIVEDPDGNAVGLMSPIDTSKATAPPDPTA